MKRRQWSAAVLVAAALVLPACGGAVSDEHEIEEPMSLTPVRGTDLQLVTLEQSAVDRLQIQTVPVMENGGGMAVPSAATFVQPDGTWWVYTSPAPLKFVRHEISVASDDGNMALLTEGPPVGTQVATVGVPELVGAEFEIGH